MGKMDDIRVRLDAGTTPAELVAQGYPKSSVYAGVRSLKRRSARVGSSQRPIDGPGVSNAAPSISIRSLAPSLPPDLADDPELLELSRDLVKAKLQTEIARVQGDAKRLDYLEAALTRLQEWAVETVSSVGQAVAESREGDYDGQSFREWENENLDLLRGRD